MIGEELVLLRAELADHILQNATVARIVQLDFSVETAQHLNVALRVTVVHLLCVMLLHVVIHYINTYTDGNMLAWLQITRNVYVKCFTSVQLVRVGTFAL